MKQILFPCALFLFYSVLGMWPLTGQADQPKDYDIVRLNSGTVLEGSLVVENNDLVTIDTFGGSVTVPISTVGEVVRSRPGESELLLGLHLLNQRKLERAEALLKKAGVYASWREESKKALESMDQINKEIAEQKKQQEQSQIEDLIRRKGLQAGIQELERRNQPEDQPGDDFWGSYRGRLHLLMAKERLDHYDISTAERHLLLAEEYGVDPEQWEKVRKDLLSLRRESVLLGPDALAARQFAGKKPPQKKEEGKGHSPLLALARKAQQEGARIPPFDLLQCVDKYAQLNELDPFLVWALIDVESSWQSDAVSPKGAQGLMQLMPPTAKDLEISDPFNPEENIRGGTQYMRFLFNMFDDEDTALAAYNFGPGRVERNGVSPEGTQYVRKIRTRLAALRQRFQIASSS